jgi:hypothetical protein
MTRKIILKYQNKVIENAQVEWYSGNELYTHPRRIKINGIWEDVFQYDRISRENTDRQREIAFRCHIGDNRFVKIIIQS